MKDATHIERRLRISGVLLALGLLAELGTLRWLHPAAFLVFLLVGGLLMVPGVLLYLYALVSSPPSNPARR